MRNWGDASYALYLLHWPVVCALKELEVEDTFCEWTKWSIANLHLFRSAECYDRLHCFVLCPSSDLRKMVIGFTIFFNLLLWGRSRAHRALSLWQCRFISRILSCSGISRWRIIALSHSWTLCTCSASRWSLSLRTGNRRERTTGNVSLLIKKLFFHADPITGYYCLARTTIWELLLLGRSDILCLRSRCSREPSSVAAGHFVQLQWR